MAPPRNIADITAILDQQKPDAAVIANRRRIADSTPPADATKGQLWEFYTQRSQAHSELGRAAEAAADAEQAFANAEPRSRQRSASFQSIIGLHQINREPAKAVQLLRDAAPQNAAAPPNVRISLHRQLVRNLVTLGDIAAAERELAALGALTDDTRSKASAEDIELYGGLWQGNLNLARGTFLEARGQWKEAETAYVRAETGFRDAIVKRPRWPGGQPLAALQQIADIGAVFLSRTKREQGRLAEAEVDARRALLNQLSLVGKYHQNTASMCQALAIVLRDQGRFEEYERLSRVALDILRSLGVLDDSEAVV
ncbi:MAG TPA: tetratricopeptide repeat protein, partial [Reyranella sp.]|nr:tetratricopeptide repeat protein [Reyranella sp.]